jgi:tRNA threonylcarbamoyladenosine biosynthesis protein TsaE
MVRGMARGAGADAALVSSPTYVLLNVYPAGTGGVAVYHLDAYRVGGEEDFAAVGFEELLESGGLVVVEWAERVEGLLPGDRVEVAIERGEDEGQRVVRVWGTGVRGKGVAEAVMNEGGGNLKFEIRSWE